MVSYQLNEETNISHTTPEDGHLVRKARESCIILLFPYDKRCIHHEPMQCLKGCWCTQFLQKWPLRYDVLEEEARLQLWTGLDLKQMSESSIRRDFFFAKVSVDR